MLAESGQQSLVIFHRGARRNILIAPTVINDEFAAAGYEGLQIRRNGANDAVVDLPGEGQVLADIESLEIPVRILEDDIFEKVVGHRERPRTARGPGPAQLTAGLEAGKNFLAGLGVDQRRVDFFGRLDLSGREAIGAVRAFALGHGRVEFAVRGIADDTVLDAVARI